MGRGTVIKIFLLVVGAFALRAVGSFYGLPYIYHQDEPMMVTRALGMGAAGSLHPNYFVIPSFVMTVLLFLYAGAYAIGKAVGVFGTSYDFALTYYVDPTFFYASGRLLLGAGFGAATVWAVWRMGRKYFSESAGWLGAILLSVAFLHVQNSRHIYADVPMTFFLVMFFGSVFAIFKNPSGARAGKAGAWLGLAMAAKYNAVLAALPAAAWLLAKRMPATPARKGLLLLLAGGAATAMFFIVNPYILLDWTGFVDAWSLQKNAQSFTGYSYHLFYSLANGLGLVMLALAIIGGAGWVRRRHAEGTALVFFVLLYYGICIYFGQLYARYMVPVTPFICLAAGEAITRAVSRAQRWAAGAAVMLVLFAGALPLAASVYEGVLMMREDTRTQAARWIEKAIPEGSRIALDHPFFGPKLSQTRAQIEAKRDTDTGPAIRTDFQVAASSQKKSYETYFLAAKVEEHPNFASARPALAATTEALEKAGVRYVVFNTQDANPDVSALRDWAAKNADLAAIFTPYRNSRIRTYDPMALTAGPILLSELFSRERMGPYLEIYELR